MPDTPPDDLSDLTHSLHPETDGGAREPELASEALEVERIRLRLEAAKLDLARAQVEKEKAELERTAALGKTPNPPPGVCWICNTEPGWGSYCMKCKRRPCIKCMDKYHGQLDAHRTDGMLCGPCGGRSPRDGAKPPPKPMTMEDWATTSAAVYSVAFIIFTIVSFFAGMAALLGLTAR